MSKFYFYFMDAYVPGEICNQICWVNEVNEFLVRENNLIIDIWFKEKLVDLLNNVPVLSGFVQTCQLFLLYSTLASIAVTYCFQMLGSY